MRPFTLNRRQLLLSAGAVAIGLPSLDAITGCAPKPSIDAARHTLQGLWDAVVPGTFNGIVEDWISPGVAAPGAGDAFVQEWFETMSGRLPGPLADLTDWFLRAWAADLDLWADTFHLGFDGLPAFGDLPLGPTLRERGRQYKIMLMMGVFDGLLDVKYLAAIALSKLAFYADFNAEVNGTPRVGGPYIGFRDPPSTTPYLGFSFNRPAGRADHRLQRTTDGLVMVP